MRDPKRIDVITNTLNELWHKYPDMRFWQLLSNINWDYRGDMYYVEDDSIKVSLDKAIKEGFQDEIWY